MATAFRHGVNSPISSPPRSVIEVRDSVSAHTFDHDTTSTGDASYIVDQLLGMKPRASARAAAKKSAVNGGDAGPDESATIQCAGDGDDSGADDGDGDGDGDGNYDGHDGDGDDSVRGDQAASLKRKAGPRSRPPSTSSKKPRRAAAAPKKPARDKKWESPFVYTDTKSPLTQADLRAILLLPEAWDILTPEERQEVLAKFPDKMHILDSGTEAARPNPESLRNDDNFRHDCTRYCENLELGRYDDDWLYQAWTAHEKHKRGDFDRHLQRRFEEDWRMKLPEDHLPSRLHRQQNHEESLSGSSREPSGEAASPSNPDTGLNGGAEGGAGQQVDAKCAGKPGDTLNSSATPKIANDPAPKFTTLSFMPAAPAEINSGEDSKKGPEDTAALDSIVCGESSHSTAEDGQDGNSTKALPNIPTSRSSRRSRKETKTQKTGTSDHSRAQQQPDDSITANSGTDKIDPKSQPHASPPAEAQPEAPADDIPNGSPRVELGEPVQS
ncbi:Asx homology domain-containing protein [Lasiosphaeria ovina]|uniref:Asx homology domain-containing protein n=1 Tax=Lasiosphaeria ovina TaxID=92902 RepID=A0AAE0N8C7_9PEZI|nr:Asx homology domain-containing protein [Lasiosphaeria ovina]